MAITKIGSSILRGSGKKVFEGLKKLGPISMRGAKGLAEGAIKGTGAAGKALGNHPYLTLGIGSAALGTSLFGKNRMNKNLYHVDPNYNVTQQELLGVAYKNPKFYKHLQDKNLLY